ERCQVLVERLVVPEAGSAAAYAPMPRLNGIAHTAIPLRHRAGVVGHRPAAAHLVQAIALPRFVVVPRLNKESGVIVGAAIAGVVHAAGVELTRTALVVELGPTAQHQ